MPPVLAAALRRLGTGLATLVAASLVVFVVLDLLPGNAAAILLGTSARPDTVAALTRELGLDRPAPWRYLAWVGGMLTGDFGASASYGVPVGRLIAERLPVTLPLAGLALVLAGGFGIPAGILAGARPGRLADRVATALAVLGVAVPDFWLGLLLVLLFSTTLHLLPSGGFPGWGAGPLAALGALVLPAIALAVPQAAVLARTARAAVRDVAGQAFIRTARSLGVGPRAILWGHLAPNALVPVVTVLGLQVSFLVAGSVLVENVFTLPGLGRLATQALAQRDLPVIRGVAMVFAALVVAVNGLVDILVLRLDPHLGAP